MQSALWAVCAALLLACLPGFVGASEGAGLFSAYKEDAESRPLSRGLLGEAAGGAGDLELHGGGLALSGEASSEELRSRVAEVDLGQLESARLGIEGRRLARLGLNLFPDAAFEAVLERSAPTTSGYTLAGRLAGDPLSTVALAVNGEWVAGTVWSPHGRYVIRPLGGGVAEVRQVDPSSQGRCGLGVEPKDLAPQRDASRKSGGARAGQAPPQASTVADAFPPDDGSEIDLLVVYPPFARRSAGGHLAMRALIDSDVALTNEMYRASGAAQRINLVGAVELRRRLAAEQNRNMYDFIDHLLDGSDGYMDEAHELRDAYAADLVLAHWGHLAGTGRGLTIGVVGGIALLMDNLSGNYEREAFVVANSWAFAHELGHAMGLRHERAHDPANTPFPYSHGYVVPDSSPELPPERGGLGMQTIMAAIRYKPIDIPRFSNPNLRYPDESGVAIGIAGDAPSDSADGPADAVRSLNETRRVVANFRPSTSRCRYELSPPDSLPASGGKFRIGVKAGSSCPWSAWSNDGHVSVLDGASGVGDGEVVFRVSANESWERDVAVFVAGEAYLAEQATDRERRVPPPVCERPSGIRAAITAAAGKETCGEVMASDLASIRVLDLGSKLKNEEGNLPIGSLDGLAGLVSLDLSGNYDRLMALEPDLFDGLTKLNALDLEDNHLRALSADAFDGVPNLVTLNLADNPRLTTLEPGAFRGLANMETLILNEIALTELKAGTFDGLSNLRTLALRNLLLTKVEPDAFRGLPNLFNLWIVNDSSGHPDLSLQTPLAALEPGMFNGLANLNYLILAGLQELETLPLGLFDGLDRLSSLSLSANMLKALEPGVFDRLDKLEQLSVSENELQSLELGVFDGLGELKQLYLNKNQLRSLESGVFDSLSKLQGLSLFDNQLRSLELGVFDGLSKLQWLRLSGNQLKSLQPEVFDSLSRLEFLYLENNRLEALPPNLFNGQRWQMNTIDLGSNQLDDLDPRLLRDLPNLERLMLRDNRFAKLRPGLFEGLRSLRLLDLSGNPGTPFAISPEFVRLPGRGAGLGRAPELALQVVEGAPFDMRISLSVSGGTLSAGEVVIQTGMVRGPTFSVAPQGDGPVTLTAAMPQPPSCRKFWLTASSAGMRGLIKPKVLPFILYGLPDQTLALDDAIRFDLPSVFSNLAKGTTFAVELNNPAVVEATIREGLLIVAAAEGGETIVTVTAMGPEGRRETRHFTVMVKQSIRSRWGGWRSVLLKPPPSKDSDES